MSTTPHFCQTAQAYIIKVECKDAALFEAVYILSALGVPVTKVNGPEA